MKTIPFSDVREYYERTRPDGQWFSANTMKFFKSRLPKVAYETPAGVLFISSEQGPLGVRKYTVRRQKVDGFIETIGEFNSYRTRKSALDAIKTMQL